MVDNKMMWVFKFSFENVTRVKLFQICQKNDYANDVSLHEQCGHKITLQ